MKTIMFDVDGVLAEFILSFTTLGHTLHGTSIYTSHQHRAWDVFDCMTPVQYGEVWKHINNSAEFWRTMPAATSQDVFNEIERIKQQEGNVAYFVTARHGVRAKEQTEAWLRDRGIDNPTVVMTKAKGELAKAVGAHFCIDDKATNAWCVHWFTDGKCKSYLRDYPYNADPTMIGSSHVRRVKTVEDFLEEVERS